MNILFIAPGFPPYMFSENIVNGKLVLAFKKEGWHVDVLSKKDEGASYSTSWIKPFESLKEVTHELNYLGGSKLSRFGDLLYSTLVLNGYPLPGIRWGKRAYFKALELLKDNSYDVIITRSPNDISHLVGFKLSKKTKTPWIANWNDPAATIWPEPYTHRFSILNKLILNRFINKALKKASINTFPSETLKNHFATHYPVLDKKQSAIIPHIALIEEEYDTLPRTTSNQKVIRMCHAGNLSSERDPNLFFKALKKIKDECSMSIHLDIMGVINDYTESLIKKYDLQNEIKYIGGFPFIDALKKMSNYDVLVLIEAEMDFGIFFPSKLVDYNQVDVPILAISPKRGYTNSLFSKFKAGVAVYNNDEQDIYNGLKKLIELKSKGKLEEAFDLGALQKFYSTKEIINQYKKIFKGLTS